MLITFVPRDEYLTLFGSLPSYEFIHVRVACGISIYKISLKFFYALVLDQEYRHFKKLLMGKHCFSIIISNNLGQALHRSGF